MPNLGGSDVKSLSLCTKYHLRESSKLEYNNQTKVHCHRSEWISLKPTPNRLETKTKCSLNSIKENQPQKHLKLLRMITIHKPSCKFDFTLYQNQKSETNLNYSEEQLALKMRGSREFCERKYKRLKEWKNEWMNIIGQSRSQWPKDLIDLSHSRWIQINGPK